MQGIEKNQKSKIKSQKYGRRYFGFTLIELMITLGLVAVISSGVVSLIGQGPKRNSRDTRRRTDLQSIASALALYRNDVGQYPAASGLDLLRTQGYISAIPTDPLGGGRLYAYGPDCGSGRCVSYVLCAAGEADTTADTACGTLNCGSTCSISVTSL